MAGPGLIWVRQRAVMYLAKPSQTSISQGYGWQSELVRAGNIITVQFLVMVTIRPIDEVGVSREAGPLLLLQSGQEEGEVGPSVSNQDLRSLPSACHFERQRGEKSWNHIWQA